MGVSKNSYWRKNLLNSDKAQKELHEEYESCEKEVWQEAKENAKVSKDEALEDDNDKKENTREDIVPALQFILIIVAATIISVFLINFAH